MLVSELLNLIELNVESSTLDFSILRKDREVYLPEISIFPLNKESINAYNQQNKVVIHTLYSYCYTPVLYLVEYNDQAVMFLLIHLYFTYDRFPSRWIIDQSLYKEMLNYLLSLFRENKEFNCFYDNFNSELSYVDINNCLYKREVDNCNLSYSLINKPEILLEEEKHNIKNLVREFIYSYGIQ
jgi:hypothetical protein